MNRYILPLILSLLASPLFAQTTSSMEEFMYSSGKINVVIAVILAILLLIIFYLIRLDRRIKRMEDDV